MIGALPVWSTKRPDDPASIGHRMQPDSHGRPMTPVCLRTTNGLWFRRNFAWNDVPEHQRCPDCAAVPEAAEV